LATGVLPYGLRGDAKSLPKLNLENLATQPDVKTSVEDFKAQVRAHQLNEELRLMYVAVTRPKQELLLTASYWKPANAKPRKVSSFLQQAADYLQIELPQNELEENPIGEQELVETWPLDPLGEKHRRVLQQGEQQVLSAIEELQNKVQGVLEGDRIQSEITLLLAEVEDRLSAAESFEIPVRVPASSFKDYIGDFAELAARYRRPMPQPPYKQTRTGTLFHGWVEKHFEKLALADGNISADDAQLPEQDMQALQQNFMNSRFSKLNPVDVEREIQLTVGEHTFICKLDAVFETEDGFEIVDWKTGKSPKDDADAKAKVLQLALYRLAYAKFTGVPIEKISVCFYFVAENKELKPSTVPDEAELLELWQQVITAN
jgi:DNA helicase-2/ATP-dependent DNA helicase PcrA